MKILLLIVLSIFLMPDKALAEEVHVYLFYSSTCSICESERKFLRELDNVKIHEFDTYKNEENYNNMAQVKNLYGISREGVPFTVVGDTAILGYNTSKQKKISKLINRYSTTDYYDRTGVFLGLYQDEMIEKEENQEINNNNQDEKQVNKNSKSGWIYLAILVVAILIINYLYFYNKRLKRSE